MPITERTLPLLERLTLPLKLASLLLDVLGALLTLPFRAAATADRHVQNAVLRALTRKLSVAQLQFLRGTTADTFVKWKATRLDEPLSSEAIAEDAALHWIGRSDAEKVLLLIHGGGYILPLSVGHLKMMTAFRESLLQAGLDVSVAILEYTTAPQAAYPTQFRQAVAALAHLTARGRAPSSIAVLGDSAGAHIALCAAAHVLHPHPAVPALAPAGALAGLCCLSPRTSNATDAPSCAANTRRDTLERATFRRWIDAFRAGSALAGAAGAAADGAYTAPVDAPAGWWTGFGERVARRVFVSAGAHECLRDYQVAFAEQMRAVPGVDVTLVVEPQGIHDSPLMDIGSGRPKTDLIRAVEAWLAQTFGA